MSSLITITNAIPVVFRHIKHLRTAVDNILQQTLLPNEIIIIISEYIKNENNDNIIIDLESNIKKHKIKPIIKTFANVQYAGKNRQIAYDLCLTHIIIFQDCDDFTHKKRNEIFVNIYEKHKIPHILHGWTDDKNAKNREIDINNIVISNKINKLCTHNGAIFINKSIIGALKFPDTRKGQDVLLNNLISSKFQSKLLVCNDMYIYNNDLSSWSKN
jgi:hypothetical protein